MRKQQVEQVIDAMALEIEHIDAIARSKQRDVLFVEFRRINHDRSLGRLVGVSEWRELHARQQIIDWLNAEGIGWNPCGEFAHLDVRFGYRGQIYIDIPFDRDLYAYRELEAFLENPDGTMRIPGARFCCVAIDDAMNNAEHDEPGFLERLTDRF
ncbi:hypothetical protein ACLFKS_24655 [Paraburkholderia sp. BR10879]|uniref:hypothetical protein n=2 Tax=unclassified Paraburkholderia TaxID=2615204 RepID=UPI0034CDDE7A